MNKNYFIVPLIVYPFDVLFYIGGDYESIEFDLSQILPDETCKYISEFIGTTDARTIMFKTGQICIWLRKFDHNVVAHEIFHSACALMWKLGVKINFNNEELIAYLIGHITGEYYKNYSSLYKNIKDESISIPKF